MIPSFRSAGPDDVDLLAEMNFQLIRAENHRNSMNPSELADRMHEWLNHDYEAVMILLDRKPIGYALFKLDPDYVYIRQLFVRSSVRRRGIGRSAIQWLVENRCQQHRRLRLDVLVDNQVAIAFWRSVGLRDYCLTLEKDLDET